jgi:hypothetical protein
VTAENPAIAYGHRAVQTPALRQPKSSAAAKPPAKTPAPTLGAARQKAGWTRSTDPYRPHHAKILAQMFDEPFSIRRHYRANLSSTAIAKAIRMPSHLEFVNAYASLPENSGRARNEVETRANGIGGFADKRKGVVYVHDHHDNGRARVEYPIHEIVHLFARPVKSTHGRSRFRAIFGTKFTEGMTQYFTELFLFEAGFEKWKTGTYKNYLYQVELVIGWLGRDANDLCARAFFAGKVEAIIDRMASQWGEQVVTEWRLKLLTGDYDEAEQLLRDSPVVRTGN